MRWIDERILAWINVRLDKWSKLSLEQAQHLDSIHPSNRRGQLYDFAGFVKKNKISVDYFGFL